MKKIIKVSLVVLLGSSMLIANQIKLYEVKSGKVTYDIKGSGEIMAGSKTQTIGKKRVIFDDYGAKNLTEENKIEKQTVMGKKNVTKSHTMTYMKDGITYHVDFNHKRIMRMENMGVAMAMGGSKNIKQAGEEMMKKMGGKKTGTDKVLGYTCDAWDLMGIKQCIYKGIPLKIESNIAGIKSTEIATKVEFDISLSSDDFKLPEFPIYDVEGNKLDRSKLDAMDKQAALKAKEAAEAMGVLTEAVSKAAKDAGVKEGQSPTKAQKKAMGDAMMNAMWPQMKKRILAEGKALRFAKECLSSADTLKEAKVCEDKMGEMSEEMGDPEDRLTKWDAKTKKETLGFIEQGLENMKCVERANNMQDIQRCAQ